MATHSRGPLAGFRWLGNGIDIGFRNPKPLFGGAAIVALIALIPSFITVPIQLHAMTSSTTLSPSFSVWMMLFSMLYALLILPLYAGYLQLADTAARKAPASPGDVFRPYREGKALRIIGYGVLMFLIYIGLFAAVFLSTGTGIVHWYMEAVTAQANHVPPPSTLPDHFGFTMLLAIIAAMFMMGFYSIGLGQVTLANRGVIGAIGDGLVGALKNILPLLMLLVGIILVAIAAAICFGIIAFVLMLIGKLVSPIAMIVLLVPLYIAFVLLMFTVMFGVMYHLWRDVCGGDSDTRATEAIAV